MNKTPNPQTNFSLPAKPATDRIDPFLLIAVELYLVSVCATLPFVSIVAILGVHALNEIAFWVAGLGLAIISYVVCRGLSLLFRSGAIKAYIWFFVFLTLINVAFAAWLFIGTASA